MQNDKSRFGLQKPLFCNAKGTVPPCKTGVFREQLINENEEISKLV